MAVMTRAVFLDTDGTLIENVPYNADPQRVALVRGARGALRELTARGYLLIAVSNQSGVALGHFSEHALTAVEQRIQALLAPSGVRLDAFYYCPHLPQAPNARYAVRCLCRKPEPGLLRRAAREWDIDLTRSWLVGDRLDDVEAGNRAGCRTVLLCKGNETEWRGGMQCQPHYRAVSLRGAAQLIVSSAPAATGFERTAVPRASAS